MNERPIIMSGDNPKLILEGRKTQTRRIVKPQPRERLNQIWKRFPDQGDCPYGIAGDRLWVRETWAVSPVYDAVKPKDLPTCPVWYQADDIWLLWKPPAHTVRLPGKTRQSIFMMEWMSRSHLDITKVRVERLQDITEEDAKAEGWPNKHDVFHPSIESSIRNSRIRNGAVRWDSLHGKGAWDKNPWVWVIEFKKV